MAVKIYVALKVNCTHWFYVFLLLFSGCDICNRIRFFYPGDEVYWGVDPVLVQTCDEVEKCMGWKGKECCINIVKRLSTIYYKIFLLCLRISTCAASCGCNNGPTMSEKR